MAEYVAGRMAEKLESASELRRYLDSDAVLVPVPKSSRHVTDSLWPSLELAKALRTRGFGRVVVPYLTRASTVVKAAYAQPKDRPTAQTHYESLEVSPHLAEAAPRLLMLVDDVVTRGATLIGCASRLHDCFPEAKIRSFAVFRRAAPADDYVVPRVETIRLEPSGQTFRGA